MKLIVILVKLDFMLILLSLQCLAKNAVIYVNNALQWMSAQVALMAFIWIQQTINAKVAVLTFHIAPYAIKRTVSNAAKGLF